MGTHSYRRNSLAALAGGLAYLLIVSAAPAYTTIEFNQLRQTFHDQENAGDFEKAQATAQQLVDGSRPNAATQPLRLAQALCLLGDAHVNQGNFVIAEPLYTEALDLVQKNATPGSKELVAPLAGLGTVQSSTQRHELAVDTLGRALVLSRRNSGLLDASQLGILRTLTESFLRLRRFDEADAQMNYIERIGEHVYGEKDTRMAGVLNEVGRYDARVGRIAEARLKYTQALGIIEANLGKKDPALIPSLRGLSDSYIQELNRSLIEDRDVVRGAPDPLSIPSPDGGQKSSRSLSGHDLDSTGIGYLRRALAILDSEQGKTSPELAETLIDMGDWLVVAGATKNALPYYQRALSVLGSVKVQDGELSGAPLSSPVALFLPLPRLVARNLDVPRDAVDEKFVQFEFTVTADGGTADLHVLDKDASDAQVAEVERSIRMARYRPKFVDGNPVDTPGLHYRQVFKVRK